MFLDKQTEREIREFEQYQREQAEEWKKDCDLSWMETEEAEEWAELAADGAEFDENGESYYCD